MKKNGNAFRLIIGYFFLFVSTMILLNDSNISITESFSISVMLIAGIYFLFFGIAGHTRDEIVEELKKELNNKQDSTNPEQDN